MRLQICIVRALKDDNHFHGSWVHGEALLQNGFYLFFPLARQPKKKGVGSRPSKGQTIGYHAPGRSHAFFSFPVSSIEVCCIQLH